MSAQRRRPTTGLEARTRRRRWSDGRRPAGWPAAGRGARGASARHDRQAELARQVVGLIEAACNGAQRMERHRHDGVRVLEQVRAGLAHHAPERFGEQPAPRRT